MVKKIFAIIMIAAGSFLEIYYYMIRFQRDGIVLWLSVIIGCALTLFLCMAVTFRKGFLVKALILILIIYSVLATSAGQSFSLAVRENEEIQTEIKEQYTQDEINDTEYRIKQIDEKYKQIQVAIEETAKTLHDRGLYRTTLKAAEDEQKMLNKERDRLQEQLSELRQQATSREGIEKRQTNIYEFYNSLTLVPTNWLQFIFQTLLSIFIAIMAPLGITTMQMKDRKYKKRKKIDNINDWKQLVSWWVQVNWLGYNNGKNQNIVGIKTFKAYSEKYNKKFTQKQYNAIKKAAVLTKCIENEKILIDDKEAVKRILDVLNGS